MIVEYSYHGIQRLPFLFLFFYQKQRHAQGREKMILTRRLTLVAATYTTTTRHHGSRKFGAQEYQFQQLLLPLISCWFYYYFLVEKLVLLFFKKENLSVYNHAWLWQNFFFFFLGTHLIDFEPKQCREFESAQVQLIKFLVDQGD